MVCINQMHVVFWSRSRRPGGFAFGTRALLAGAVYSTILRVSATSCTRRWLRSSRGLVRCRRRSSRPD